MWLISMKINQARKGCSQKVEIRWRWHLARWHLARWPSQEMPHWQVTSVSNRGMSKRSRRKESILQNNTYMRNLLNVNNWPNVPPHFNQKPTVTWGSLGRLNDKKMKRIMISDRCSDAQSWSKFRSLVNAIIITSCSFTAMRSLDNY